jgi:hypothetical protein
MSPSCFSFKLWSEMMESSAQHIASQLFQRNKLATVLEITQWTVGHSGLTEPDFVREVIEHYQLIRQRFEASGRSEIYKNR